MDEVLSQNNQWFPKLSWAFERAHPLDRLTGFGIKHLPLHLPVIQYWRGEGKGVNPHGREML